MAFLATLAATSMPRKGAFARRAMVALVIAIFLAHFNRNFEVDPAHLLFPSGHTTFCFGLAISLAMLRPWTLLITMPLLVVLAVSMVHLHYHSMLDVVGAIPLVIVIYGAVHWLWRLSPHPIGCAGLDTQRI